MIWGVENCKRLVFKVSWKPRNWRKKIANWIDRKLVIHHFKYGVLTTFLLITFQMLILEYTYCFFFNFTKAGLLKNVQKHLSTCFRSWERGKTKVGTFFNTLYSYMRREYRKFIFYLFLLKLLALSLVPGLKFLLRIPDRFYQILGTWYLILDTCYMLLDTWHLKLEF